MPRAATIKKPNKQHKHHNNNRHCTAQNHASAVHRLHCTCAYERFVAPPQTLNGDARNSRARRNGQARFKFVLRACALATTTPLAMKSYVAFNMQCSKISMKKKFSELEAKNKRHRQTVLRIRVRPKQPLSSDSLCCRSTMRIYACMDVFAVCVFSIATDIVTNVAKCLSRCLLCLCF